MTLKAGILTAKNYPSANRLEEIYFPITRAGMSHFILAKIKTKNLLSVMLEWPQPPLFSILVRNEKSQSLFPLKKNTQVRHLLRLPPAGRLLWQIAAR